MKRYKASWLGLVEDSDGNYVSVADYNAMCEGGKKIAVDIDGRWAKLHQFEMESMENMLHKEKSYARLLMVWAIIQSIVMITVELSR